MTKTIKIITLVAFVLLVFSQVSMAREFADIYTECGIGAMIAPRNTAVAAVTNVTWDSGTTAISTHITTPDSCVGGQAKTAAFIHDTYDSLEQDLASGHGEYLDSLLALIGQGSEANRGFIEVLRNDFAKIVATSEYTSQSRFKKAEALYKIIYKHI